MALDRCGHCARCRSGCPGIFRRARDSPNSAFPDSGHTLRTYDHGRSDDDNQRHSDHDHGRSDHVRASASHHHDERIPSNGFDSALCPGKLGNPLPGTVSKWCSSNLFLQHGYLRHCVLLHAVRLESGGVSRIESVFIRGRLQVRPPYLLHGPSNRVCPFFCVSGMITGLSS